MYHKAIVAVCKTLFILMLLVTALMPFISQVNAQTLCVATVVRVPVGGPLPITYVPDWNHITVPQRGLWLGQVFEADAIHYSNAGEQWVRIANTYTWVQYWSGPQTDVYQLTFYNDVSCPYALQVLQ